LFDAFTLINLPRVNSTFSDTESAFGHLKTVPGLLQSRLDTCSQSHQDLLFVSVSVKFYYYI